MARIVKPEKTAPIMKLLSSNHMVISIDTNATEDGVFYEVRTGAI
jgi:hypothetical protein